MVELDNPNGRRSIRSPAVHTLDELLARVATLGEVDGQRHDAGHRWDRLARHDLVSHPRPSEADADSLVIGRWVRCSGGEHRQLGIDTDLETLQALRQQVAESSVGVEIEAVIGDTRDSGERGDLAVGLEYERPARGTDCEVTHVLSHLRLQVCERVSTFDDHMVACGFVECGGVWSHATSLAWHTAIFMDFDDDISSGRITALAERAVDALLTLVRRGTRLAFGTLLVVTFVCAIGFALGIAALSNGAEKVWILFGGFAAAIAIGSVVIAMVRLGAIARISTTLVTEVERLIAGDPRSERVVIDAVEASDDVHDQSAVAMSRQFFTMSAAVGDDRKFAALAVALRSVTIFPLLMLLATAITIAFVGLSLLFLLALAL